MSARFNTNDKAIHQAFILAALAAATTVMCMSAPAWGQTRGAVQGRAATQNTTAATGARAPSSAATRGTMPAANVNLPQLARDLSNSATHDAALTRAKGLPASSIVAVWDLIDDPKCPAKAREELQGVLP